MIALRQLQAYLVSLSAGRTALWCYLLWYLGVVWRYFDPAPALWLNALGISAVVGVALLLSVGGPRAMKDRWQTFRLFLMPFCVSSFSALIKGRGFVLVVPASVREAALLAAPCVAFVLLVWWLRRRARAGDGRSGAA